MKKVEFISELKEKLKKLPEKELNDAVEYYTEYFEDAGEENEDKVIKELVSPSVVASQILMEYVIEDNKEIKSIKKSLMAIGIGFSALCGATIVLPLVFAVIMVLFSIMIVFGVLIFSLFVVDIAFIFCGGIFMIAALILIVQHIPTAFVIFGSGCLLLGVGLILFSPIKKVSLWGYDVIAKGTKNTVNKVMKSIKKEKQYEIN